MNDVWTTHAIVGALATCLALAAVLGDRRRMRRRDPDRVGFVPWTPIFFMALIAACVLLGLAAREWFGG